MRYTTKDGLHHKLKGGTAYRQSDTLKDWIKERDNHTCQLCGQPGDIVDHIIPWQVSYNSFIGNLRVLCRKCNLATRRQQVNARLPYDEWIEQIKAELNNLRKELCPP